MKHSLLLILFFFVSFNLCFAQNLNDKLRRNLTSIKKEKLNEVKSMSEIIPYYPSLWIMHYVSGEITATSGGKVIKAIGSGETLNAEQKNILNVADIGSEIKININYQYKNAVTDNIENSTMHFSTFVVSGIEAEYPGGYEQMTKYLNENVIDKIYEASNSKRISIPPAGVTFIVDEEGQIIDAKITLTSKDPKIDKLLLDATNKMPKWKPAQNENGKKIKQEFNFNIPFYSGGGC